AIAERVRKAWAELDKAEQETKANLASDIKEITADTRLNATQKNEQAERKSLTAWHKLRQQRDLVLFLTSCLGDFTVPVGVPILCEMAAQEKGAEIKGLS